MRRVHLAYLGVLVACLAYPISYFFDYREPSFYLPVCAGIGILGFSYINISRIKKTDLVKMGVAMRILTVMHIAYFVNWSWDYMYPDYKYFWSILVFIITILICLMIQWVISARSH